ncbi:hypothetical protein [Actinokineospora inagensis]|uniref:hypothetical protein n=1 Tax=Actinokineospora inagensis TaxID=103730 RepID=UPI000418FABF|nr:hypothetical protein [Actinokineospora inagensis]
MTSGEQNAHSSSGDVPNGGRPVRGRVAVRVRADLANLPVLRTVAGVLAAGLDDDPDTWADLTLAVDEVAATLVGLAAPGAVLECAFVPHAGALEVDASVEAVDDAGPDTTSFGWQVLTALADSVECGVAPGSDGRPKVHINVLRTGTAGAG